MLYNLDVGLLCDSSKKKYSDFSALYFQYNHTESTVFFIGSRDKIIFLATAFTGASAFKNIHLDAGTTLNQNWVNDITVTLELIAF